MRREALRLSLSADCFKTSNNMNMLGLDVYWISKSWEFKHLTLGLHRLANAVGTADALTSATRSVIESLKLKQQVYAIASDTTAVMPAYVSADESLLVSMPRSSSSARSKEVSDR
jgi:hypothetical protein